MVLDIETVLVTGTSRGIGLEFVRQLSQLPKIKHVIATCRTPEDATELQEIAKNSKNVHIIKLDVRNIDSYTDVMTQVKSILKDTGLNLLINNAGTACPFNSLEMEQLMDCYHVNSISPLMFTKACVPLLRQSAEQNRPTLVINLSSALGIISNVGCYAPDIYWYPFRMSKAALNMVTKLLSVEYKDDNIKVISMSPGYTKTDLGGPDAFLDPIDSIQYMLSTIENVLKDDTLNGVMLLYNGQKLPW